MNVEGQYNPKDVECIPVENLEVLPSGADWQSRHLESERRKAEIRDRIHKQTEQGQKTAKDYFRPAKPTPSIYDSDLKRVAVYARVSTSSEEQISSIENQTLYYTKKIAETENWNLQDIYSDEGKSGTSLRKRDAFKRMMRDAKDQKIRITSFPTFILRLSAGIVTSKFIIRSELMLAFLSQQSHRSAVLYFQTVLLNPAVIYFQRFRFLGTSTLLKMNLPPVLAHPILLTPDIQ